MFSSDVPPCCTSPARLLYKMFLGRRAALHLAAQYCRMHQSRPGAPELPGGLFSSGFASQYAARARALLQALVSMWLSPTASLENRVVLTNAS